MANRTTGQLGEQKAADWLEASGFRVIERNYRCRFGEADLVVWDGQTVWLVEVKARSGSGFGEPAEAIGRAKLARMQRVAESYQHERQTVTMVRLAVVTILGDNPPELITEIEAID